MEIRQLKYLLKVVEYGSMGKAALELGIGTSALSQQLSKLESELSTRLLIRSASGVLPTSAGIAFMNHARLAIRHTEQAALAAQQERTSGKVSIGLPPTTASVLAMPLIESMQKHYPKIQLHIVESLSGHLVNMLNSRQIDLAVVFSNDSRQRWCIKPMLDEKLFFIASPDFSRSLRVISTTIKELPKVGLILPSDSHGLRAILIAAFKKQDIQLTIKMEIDGLTPLMEAVRRGFGATIQPGAAVARADLSELNITRIADKDVGRRNILVSLPDDEISPSALAARVVILRVAKELVAEGAWPGATWVTESTRRSV